MAAPLWGFSLQLYVAAADARNDSDPIHGPPHPIDALAASRGAAAQAETDTCKV